MDTISPANKVLKALKDAFVLLKQNDPLILASSTAFFATFSLSPIIIILVQIMSLYYTDDRVSSGLFGKIKSTFGEETAQQIQHIVNNVQQLNTSWWITIGGFIFLIFVATTLLRVVKQAIHLIWHIKKGKVGRLRYNFSERAIGITLILFIGFLFIVSLILDASTALLHTYLEEIMPSVHVSLIRALNILFSVLVVTAWFTILFKLLPDAHLRWSVAIRGGLLTSILFSIGKWVLRNLLVYSNIENIFGTSTSLVLILLFIFYSSLILYYGAAFTYTYGEAVDKPVHHGKYSESYEMKVINPDED
jgi:membrane protein